MSRIGDPIEICVLVTPNAKTPLVTKINESNYRVRVDALATEGRANARLIQIIAEYFKVKKSKVKILKGATSKSKVLQVELAAQS